MRRPAIGLVAAADDDMGACLQEAFGDAAADAAAPARDDDGLAGEVQWVRHSSHSDCTSLSDYGGLEI